MRCSKCNNEMLGSDAFCGVCGCPAEQSEPAPTPTSTKTPPETNTSKRKERPIKDSSRYSTVMPTYLQWGVMPSIVFVFKLFLSFGWVSIIGVTLFSIRIIYQLTHNVRNKMWVDILGVVLFSFIALTFFGVIDAGEFGDYIRAAEYHGGL